MAATTIPRTIRLTDETWGELHVVRAALIAKLRKDVNLDRVLRFLTQVFHQAREKDPQILNAAFKHVFHTENTAKVAVR